MEKRKHKKKRVVVFGIFDGLHQGHRFFLEQAKKRGEELVAVVGRDEICRILKHKTPKHTEAQRLTALEDSGLVSRVALGDKSLSSWDILDELDPDIICLGHDQSAMGDSLRMWILQKKKEIKVRSLPKC